MRRSLVKGGRAQPPVVIARASVAPVDNSDHMAFACAVDEAIRRQGLRRMSDHMAELEAAARSVDEAELEILDDIPDRN